MGLVQASDVADLLNDPELMEGIASAIVESPAVIDTLADDIAEELEDEIESSPEFRKKIIEAAMAHPDFKRKLAAKIVAEIEDD
jgi:hypothetical protein